MQVYDCLRTGLEVRSYKPDPVPEAVLTRVLQAARWAPSSRNQQPWHFIVIRERETLRKIGDIATSGRFVARAPVAVAVAIDGADRPELDAGRAIQQMAIMAWSEGLGTCFVGLRGADHEKRVKELLEIPGDMELVTVLPFGYRPEAIRGTRKRRKPLGEIAHSERFGVEYVAG